MTATAVRRGKESEADIFPLDTQECQTFLSHQNLSVTFFGLLFPGERKGRKSSGETAPVCSLQLPVQLSRLSSPSLPPTSSRHSPTLQRLLDSQTRSAILEQRRGTYRASWLGGGAVWAVASLFDSEKYPNYVKDWELMFSSCPPTRSCLIPLLLVRSPLLYFLLPPSPYTPLRGRTVYSLRFNSPKHGNLLWQKVLNGEETKQQTGHVVWKFSQSLWPNCDL